MVGRIAILWNSINRAIALETSNKLAQNFGSRLNALETPCIKVRAKASGWLCKISAKKRARPRLYDRSYNYLQ